MGIRRTATAVAVPARWNRAIRAPGHQVPAPTRAWEGEGEAAEEDSQNHRSNLLDHPNPAAMPSSNRRNAKNAIMDGRMAQANVRQIAVSSTVVTVT